MSGMTRAMAERKMMHANVRIDGARLWDSLMDMARVGPTERGGSRRIAFTPEDRAGRELFRSWCEAAGLAVTVDRFGNMFARRPGRTDKAPVLVGSHLDTQPTGGRFDGVYGVLAGLELIRTLDDAGIETERPIEIVNWTNEEGAIFRPMMGSDVFTGRLPLAEAYAMRDPAGAMLRDGLEAIGYLGEEPVGGREVHSYFEAHIEQGPVLEAEETTIGVVTGGIAFRRYAIELEGQEAHAGPTPMELRRDAMLGAAEIIVAATGHTRSIEGARATFGSLSVYPGSPNTVAGKVDFTVDLRHVDEDILDAMEAKVDELLGEVKQRHGLAGGMERLMTSPYIGFHPDLVADVESAAAVIGYSHRRIVSGAGHDACNMARAVPTAMVFIPCENGISHNEAENITPADCEAGANVLLHVVLRAANRPGELGQGGEA
jgi:beta-ureidopropionase / N-carbamoyl-L-amino-acid hydrolase